MIRIIPAAFLSRLVVFSACICLGQCITVLAPGGPGWYKEMPLGWDARSYKYLVVDKPPGLPPKGKMPENVDRRFIKEQILQAKDSGKYRDKTVWIRPREHFWSTAGMAESNEVSGQGMHSVIARSETWEAGETALLEYFRSHKLFKDYSVGSRPPDGGYDYIIEYQFAHDWGEPDTLGNILCGLTLGFYPLRAADEYYYRIVILDAKGKTVGSSRIVIAKRSYFSNFNIFVPFLWGDDYKVETWPGPVLTYLLETAAPEENP